MFNDAKRRRGIGSFLFFENALAEVCFLAIFKK
jgi:hypothetical protein